MKSTKQLTLDFATADKIREQQEMDELYKPDPDEPWWNH